MISVVTFVPLYVQSVLAGSPTDAGTAIAPIAIGWPLSSTLAGGSCRGRGTGRSSAEAWRLPSAPRLGFRSCSVPEPICGRWRLTMFFYGLGLGFANTP